MKFTHFLGVDISKETLEFTLFDGESINTFDTCPNQFRSIRTFLDQFSAIKDGMIICAEFTGKYGIHLQQVATQLKLSLWLEHPATIKWSSGIQRGKSDKVDAERIALYAYRFIDRVRLFIPEDAVVMQLRELNAERELLVSDRAKYIGQLNDQKMFVDPVVYKKKSRRLARAIKALDKGIAEIEEEMDQLILQTPKYKQQYDQITSVKGVGPQLAVTLITSTNGFSRFTSPRAFCCHAGVAPFSYTSGSSVRSSSKVSHRANKRIKALLHMAALNAIRYDGNMKKYYERKLKEGKSKLSIINAVRAKIVHIIFALIRDHRKYEHSYTNTLA
jgi:transposase